MNHAYPINLCVNTEVGAGPTANQYSIYRCNDAGNVVTKEFYNTDATCSTLESNDQTFTDTTLTPGAFNSFSCSGDIDYVITKSYLYSLSDTPTCCGDNPTVVTGATNICFQTRNGNYSMAMCDSTGNGGQWVYIDSICTQRISQMFKYNESCNYYTTQFGSVNVYYRIDTCYENGTEIAENNLCDEIPTMAPSNRPTTDNANLINIVFIIFATVFTIVYQ